MKSDKQGCSTCPKGQENYEFYYSSISKREYVQYDYRHTNGQLFSCCSRSLEKARDLKDKWLAKKEGRDRYGNT